MKNQDNEQGGRSSTRMGGRKEQSDMSENPLHKAFLDELSDIHNAEQQLIKALPKMAAAAKSDALRKAGASLQIRNMPSTAKFCTAVQL